MHHDALRPTTGDDSPALEEFAASLGARDPKTRAPYVSTCVTLSCGWLCNPWIGNTLA
jgi:hypothetical protein